MSVPTPEQDAAFLAEYVDRCREVIRGLYAAQTAIGRLEGQAESADGLVWATADGQGRVTRLSINPRALRKNERELGREVTEVLQAAQNDAARQAQEVVDKASRRADALPEPLDATFVRARGEQAIRDLI
ncbi:MULTISPECIES: YbaB/EbfC family nucleoid-associated protein [unclassified Nonomuraea]|uniref:YbaB/EbfC family nucleoid-associated protein n=1 Tax=unclassified Nonomuraea TaxID=2593643 RepID=UPI0033C34D44